MQKLLYKPKNYIALEIIDFQNNNFGMDIESIITKIKNKLADYTTADIKKEVLDLEELIYSRLKMKVSIRTNSSLAAILPFYSNKNHVFLNDFFRGEFTLKDQEAILNKSHDKEGTVDLKNAKLGGIFSEYTNIVLMNFYSQFNEYKLSASESTAVLLHELGHGFEVCEYADRLETTNQVLSNIAKELRDVKKEKNLTYVYSEVKKISKNFTQEETDKLVNGNRIIAGVTWFKLIVSAAGQNITSQMGNDKYDESSFEQLADNFSNRFGYGRQLVTGLDKLSLLHGDSAKSKSMFMLNQIMEMLNFAVMAIATAGIFISGLAPLGVLMCLVLGLVFYSFGEGGKDYTYDQLKQRYIRVRNDLVEFLKNPDVDKTLAKKVIEDIHNVDKVISGTNNHKTLFNLLSNFIIPSNRKANNSINEQNLLEELASNDLFLRSAELRTF